MAAKMTRPAEALGIVLGEVVGEPASGYDYGPGAGVGAEGRKPEVPKVSVGQGRKESVSG